MSKKRFFKMIAWLLSAIMVLNIVPIAALADDSVSGVHDESLPEGQDELEFLTLESENGVISGKDGGEVSINREDRPQEVILTITYTPPENAGERYDFKYPLGDLKPVLPLPAGDDYSVSYNETENCLVFEWNVRDREEFSIEITCLPSFSVPDEWEGDDPFDGKSFAIVSDYTGAMMLSNAISQKGNPVRQIMQSVSCTIMPDGNLRINDLSVTGIETWTFTHVSDAWYSIQNSSGKYLTFIGSNGATLSDEFVAMKIEKISDSQIIISDGNGKYLTNAQSNPASGFASYTSRKHQEMNLYPAGYVTSTAPTKDMSGEYVIVNETKQTALTTEKSGNKKLKTDAYHLYAGDKVKVADDKTATLWTFENVQGDWYNVKSGNLYLNISSGTLTVSTNPQNIFVRHIENTDQFVLSDSPYNNTDKVSHITKATLTRFEDNTVASAIQKSIAGLTDRLSKYDADAYEAEYKLRLMEPATAEDNYLLLSFMDGSNIADVTSVQTEDGEQEAVNGSVRISREGENITLPTLTGNKDFLGWSTVPAFYQKNGKETTTYHELLDAGSQYAMPADSTTLYAVWDNSAKTVIFSIRNDNEMQDEPQDHKQQEFTHVKEYKNPADYVINKRVWVIDRDEENKDIFSDGNRSFVINNVTSNIAADQIPLDSEITSAIPSYNSEEQYVNWYVIKYTGSEWHIDGIIQNRDTNELVIASATTGFVYDGTTKYDNTYTVRYNNTEVAADESGRVFTLSTGDKVTITPTAEGVMDYSADYNENNTFTYEIENRNYYSNVKANFGTLTISRRPVTFSGHSEEQEYTGSEITISQVDVTKPTGEKPNEGLLEGDTHNVTFSASGTEASATAYTGTITAVEGVKIMSGNKDVTKNYAITVNNGSLTINKTDAAFTVTLDNGTFVYDGQAHALTKEATATALTGTTTFEYSKDRQTWGSLSELKETDFRDGGYTIYVRATNPNYSQTATSQATLTISQRPVTFSGHSEEQEYTGREITISTVDVTPFNAETKVGLLSGHKHNVEFSATGKEVEDSPFTGTITAQKDVVIKDGDKDVTSNYKITVKNGELNIIKTTDAFQVTLTGAEIEYDGEDHVLAAPTVTAASGVTTIEYSKDGQNWTENLASLKAKNYSDSMTISFRATNPNYENGVTGSADLTILQKPVEITVTPAGKTYGDADPAFTGTVKGLVKDGDLGTVSFIRTNDAEDADTYAKVLTASYTENDNYDVKVNNADFVIEPLTGVTVTITEHGDSVTYNAAARTVTGYDVAISNKLYTEKDFTFSGKAEVTGTNAGTYDMELKPADFTNNNANFANVAFVIEDGKLVISPKAVRIAADNKTKTYGEKDPLLTTTITGLEGSDFITASASREEGQNVGTYAISVKADANPNYKIETVAGTLTIEPRTVTVTADDKIKVFGSADPELTAKIAGLASGDSKDLIAYTLSRAAGEDTGSYEIRAAGEKDQGNYIVEYKPGSLTIVSEDTVIVTITANNGTFLYDGTERDLSGYTVSTNNELYNEEYIAFSGDSTLKAVNAGIYRTEMKASDFTNTNPNFSNVAFLVENGELEITRRNLTLTSADATKAYDGTALTNNNVEVGGDGFAEGDGVAITVTGRLTKVGTAENTFTYVMTGETLAENYNITTVFGKLTVTQALTHKLTITYVDDRNETVKVFSRDYAPGEAYSVVTEFRKGFQADRDKVTGIMGDEDIEETVTYQSIVYTLTVSFIDFTTGAQVADPIVLQLRSGDSYAIFVPTVEGYTTLTSEVTGTMPSGNRQIAVFMVPEGTSAEGYKLISIDDYGTPLGVGDGNVLGGGELVE